MLSRFRRRRPDDGFAMIMVIGTMFVLTALVLVAFGFALSNLAGSRRTQDYNAALAAAQAGEEDFLQHLNADTSYYTFQNNSQVTASGLPSNPGLYDPATNDPAMSKTYAAIPGANGPATFRYWVLNCHTALCTELPAALGAGQAAGLLVEAQGKVNKVVRSIVVRLNKPGILRYAYYTDKETTDPALYPSAYGETSGDAQTSCSGYHYRTVNQPERTVLPDGIACQEAQFTDADVINGPLHTNDAMLLSGSPTFKSAQTETSWPPNLPPDTYSAGSPWRKVTASSGPRSCSGCYPPLFAPTISVDAYQADSAIKVAADGSQGGNGCLYTGPTAIVFLGNGQMQVTSPYTRSTNPGCMSGSLPTSGTATVSVPTNKAIYVQAIPTSSADPNYTSPSTPCPTSYGFAQNGIGYPQVSNGGIGGRDVSAEISGSIDTYSCRDGDAFVQGTVAGRTTIAAAHNSYIVGNIAYANGLSGTDVLGLVASGFIEVYHPVTCSQYYAAPYDTTCATYNNAPGTNYSPTVYAAVFSLQHSFILQNFNLGGQLGTLNVVGAIGQSFRGPVGNVGDPTRGVAPTGYSKNYTYDNRLFLSPPPYYVRPDASQWQVTSFSEQAS